MTRTKRYRGLGALLAACGVTLALGVASPAQATAILTVSDGTSTWTQTGNGTAPLMVGASNGVWSVMATGYAPPLVGSAYQPYLDLSASGAFAGNLTITFSDSGFIGTGSQDFLTNTGGTFCNGPPFCSGSGGSLSITSSTTLGKLSGLGPYSSNPFSGSAVVAQDLGTSGSYGLSIAAKIVNGGSSNWSFDANVEQVPEPGTLALLAAGAFATVLFMRRRRTVARRSAAT